MVGLLSSLLVAAGLAAVLAGFVALARRVRRSGVRAPLMGPLDEVYNPAAHRLRFDIEARQERLVPLSPADDRLRRSTRDRTTGEQATREKDDR